MSERTRTTRSMRPRPFTPVPSGVLQRTCTCGTHTGGGATCSACAEKERSLQRQATNDHDPAGVPPIVHEVLRSPGQPLDLETRTFLEPRFGHDFGPVRASNMPLMSRLEMGTPGDRYEKEADAVAQQVIRPASPSGLGGSHDFTGVRVHTGAAAASAARAINARAFTVGEEIVFGASEYAPSSEVGRRLLAHELAHVVQQAGPRAGVLQRAEVDDRSCSGLSDIETDIDTQVNNEIVSARGAAGSPIDVAVFLRDVMTRLGKGAVSPMEEFVKGLGASKRRLPGSSLADTKYSGAEAVNRFYYLQTLGAATVVGPVAKIRGICVGADKLGHFFQEGFLYFRTASKPGKSSADAESAGRALEIGIQGLGVNAPVGTGVYSNADLAANRAGMQFYKDLEANPAGLSFKIKNYITPRWNEQSNRSFYESSIGRVIWGNLLTGSWQGPFTSGGGKSPAITSKVDLAASASGSSVTGTYEWPAAKRTKRGKIKNGNITQKTISVTGTRSGEISVSATPVSGISIGFDWEEGTSSGKGKWDSVDERTLDGSWGIGSSNTGGGAWKLKKL